MGQEWSALDRRLRSSSLNHTTLEARQQDHASFVLPHTTLKRIGESPMHRARRASFPPRRSRQPWPWSLLRVNHPQSPAKAPDNQLQRSSQAFGAFCFASSPLAGGVGHRIAGTRSAGPLEVVGSLEAVGPLEAAVPPSRVRGRAHRMGTVQTPPPRLALPPEPRTMPVILRSPCPTRCLLVRLNSAGAELTPDGWALAGLWSAPGYF
jgi:hypothetical protein